MYWWEGPTCKQTIVKHLDKCPDRGEPFFSWNSVEMHGSQHPRMLPRARTIREGFQAEAAFKLTLGSKEDLARAWEKEEYFMRWGQ